MGLCEEGLLPAPYAGRRPRYYFEVKTTTLECETRFFMSKAQVKRVSCHPSNGTR